MQIYRINMHRSVSYRVFPAPACFEYREDFAHHIQVRRHEQPLVEFLFKQSTDINKGMPECFVQFQLPLLFRGQCHVGSLKRPVFVDASHDLVSAAELVNVDNHTVFQGIALFIQ